MNKMENENYIRFKVKKKEKIIFKLILHKYRSSKASKQLERIKSQKQTFKKKLHIIHEHTNVLNRLSAQIHFMFEWVLCRMLCVITGCQPEKMKC